MRAPVSARFWLIDLTTGRVQVYRDLTTARYGHVLALGRGESIVPGAFPDLTVAIADLLG
jgi:Uma2 family endonuclease